MTHRVIEAEMNGTAAMHNGAIGGTGMERSAPAADGLLGMPARRGRLALDRRASVVPAVLAALGALILFSQAPNLALILALGGLATLLFAYTRPASVPAEAIVLIGRGPLAAIVASTIESRLTRVRRVALLRASTAAEAIALVRGVRCDEVIVAGPVGLLKPALIDARGRRPAVLTGAQKLELLLGRIPLELASQDAWLARLGRLRALHPAYAFFKRLFDLGFALALGLVLLPLFPLIALAIKLDSRGPVLYSQTRIGLGGARFRIYKFRTMRVDAEASGAVWAQARDPRITRVGRFMRLTRFDELPQIWNVLRGDMAVVGPRPERPEFTELLAREIPGYSLRHTVKPGLTGWAQVRYRYTSSVRDTRAKVEYDLFYVKHLSFTFDLKIMLRTVKVVLGRKGQ